MSPLPLRYGIFYLHISLPYHFDPAEFTRGTTDNWDHEGTTSTHDAVTVLYQTKPKGPAGAKPKISETNVESGFQVSGKELVSQTLPDFQKPLTRAKIPSTYQAVEAPFILSNQSAITATVKDSIWAMARFPLSDISRVDEQVVPSWNAANCVWTQENHQLDNLAFLSVLPYPITQYDAV